MEGHNKGRIAVALGLRCFGDLAESREIEDDGVHEIEVELLLSQCDEVVEDVDVVDDADAEVGELLVDKGIVADSPLANEAGALP